MNVWIERAKKWCGGGKGMRLIVLLGLAGLALILLSELLPDGKEPEPAASAPSSQTQDASAYCKAMEADLRLLLSQIRGVGETQVMLTLSGTEEIEYAEESTRELNESGSRTQTQYVLMGTSGNPSALVKSVHNPKVTGGVVVCTGGDSNAVREQVYRTVAVACGVSTAQIHVAALAPNTKS